VSADSVLSELRSYKDHYKNEHDGKIPEFFAFITESESGEPTSLDAKLRTAMSFVYDAARNDKWRSSRIKTVYYTDLFELTFDKKDPNGTYVKRRDSILKFVEEAQVKIRRLNFISKKKNRSERILAMEEAERLFDECKEKIEKTADDHLYYMLLSELDKAEEQNKGVSSFHALLFATMCYANDGYLMKTLKKPDYEMLDLIPVDEVILPEETVLIYGHPHTMGRKTR
jgi:hypothetical protein